MKESRPFIVVYSDILGYTDLTVYERFVFMGLKKYADSKTGECFPSITTLANFLGISRRETAYCIKSLMQKGIITKKTRCNENGLKSSNLYRLNENINLWKTETTPETLNEIDENNQLDILLQAKNLDDKYLKELIPIIQARGLVSAAEQSEDKRKGLETIVHPTKETTETSPISKNSYSDNSTYHYSKPFPPNCQEETTREDSAKAETIQEMYIDPAIEEVFSDENFENTELRILYDLILQKCGNGTDRLEMCNYAARIYHRFLDMKRQGTIRMTNFKYLKRMFENELKNT